MAIGITRLDHLLEEKRIEGKGPTEREMMGMQRQHKQAVKELDRQIPLANGKFAFSK